MHARRLARILAGVLFACLTCSAFAQTVSGTPSTASKDDINFMKHTANDGVAEVKLGQLAMDKSSNAGVKNLAQRIVEDHSKANDELRTLAHGKQIMLPPPADAGPGIDGLKDKDGAKFDRAWTDMIVKSHLKAVALFTNEKRQAQDPDVRNFTNETLPLLNSHLAMARKLQHELALPDARDSAMGRHTPMGGSTFNHVASPAAAASAAPVAPAPAAASMGHH
jgi:putative membrane protein